MDLIEQIVIATRRFFPTDATPGRPAPNEAALESRRSLRKFVSLAWHVVEPANPLISNWHLDAICEHLEAVTNREIRNLVINIPPRHMKSLAVCVFWPAWEWITFPHRRFLFASYAQSLSERDSVRCRRLIESPWYQEHFGKCFQLCPDQNTKLRYDNDHAGHRIATSVGGAATGEGGDRVVVDDPHNVSDRESQAKREEALTWWDETMSTRLNDPKTGAKIIVMQRIHEKDLTGHVLEQGGYEHLFLPAEFEPARRCVTVLNRISIVGSASRSANSNGAATVRDADPADAEGPAEARRVGVLAHHRPSPSGSCGADAASGHVAAPAKTVGEYAHPTTSSGLAVQVRAMRTWADPRQAEGDLLWQERVGPKEIADFRVRLGPEGYAGQFQQRPSPAGGALFRKEWFRYWSLGDAGTQRHGDASASDAGTRRHGDAETGTDAGAIDGDPSSSPFPPSPRHRVPASSSPASSAYALLRPDGSQRLIRPQDCERFAVMDPAGTEPGEGRRPCYTVIQVWDVTRHGEMLLMHQYRRQVQAADAAKAATKICREFDVAYIAIEKDGMGLGVVQQVKRDGIAVHAIKARGCKEARSQAAEIRMANGQIYFPQAAAFLFELEKELLSFPKSDYADQVDALSHAAMQVQKMCRPHETEPVESWERDAEMALEADEAMYEL